MDRDQFTAIRATTPTTRTILRRRSVRDGYMPNLLGADLVDEIIACGESAPSAKDSRPWRLHPVADRSTLDRIATAMASDSRAGSFAPHTTDRSTNESIPRFRSSVTESAAILSAVPLGIVIENRRPYTSMRGRSPGTIGDPGRTFESVLETMGIGAAMQNMWLAATALGLSAVYLADAAISECVIKSLLGFDGDCLGVLAVGYTKPPPPAT
jgi:nitroreductase